MPSAINQLVVAELASQFRAMPNALVVDFTGMNASQANGLRARLRKEGAGMFIVKNSLAARALNGLGLDAFSKLVAGPTALIYSNDPVALTKTLRDWGKKERPLKVRGGFVGGQVLGPKGVDALALLPPLNVLRAQVAGAIAAPLAGFVGVLQGILRNLVGVLHAVADQREGKG
jgi:large subunit ribosomal protein L10